MADSSSRTLLAPHGENSKTGAGRRSTQQTPLFVFSLLTFLIASIVISIVILVTSHDDLVGSWRIQPAVLLSVVSGVYSLALGGLFVAGLAITWWKSISNGTTLKRLHFIYAGANPLQFLSALGAGSDARKVALAAALIFFVKLANGPFLQRSTRPRTHSVLRDVPMNIHLAKQIPDGFFGTVDASNDESARISQGWWFNLTMLTSNETGFSCPVNGTCEAFVPGAGLNYGCGSTTEQINLMDERSNGTSIFRIDLELNYESDQPMLWLTTRYLSGVDGSCIGTITTDACDIIPATVWYPIVIQNRTLKLDHSILLDNLAVLSNYTSAADANVTNATGIFQDSGALIGLYGGMGSIWSADAVLSGPTGYEFKNESGRNSYWARLFWDTEASFNSSTLPDFAKENCPLRFFPPTNDTLHSFFDFMFRSAFVVAGTEPEHLQNFTAVFRGEELFYRTDFRFLAVATVIMIAGLLSALLLLWGWWDLDRHVTLSPLETGKAFGAPILLSAGPEKEAKGIVEEIGHERVAYDGDELVWNGSVYTSGRYELGQGSSVRGRGSGDTEERSLAGSWRELDNESPGRGCSRGHRRGSNNNGSEGSGFEHSLGVSTRKWFGGQEGGGTMKRARQRSESGGGVPLLSLNLTPGSTSTPGSGSPQLPPIRVGGSLKMSPLSTSGRRGCGSGPSVNVCGKRPLSSIEERNSPD